MGLDIYLFHRFNMVSILDTSHLVALPENIVLITKCLLIQCENFVWPTVRSKQKYNNTNSRCDLIYLFWSKKSTALVPPSLIKGFQSREAEMLDGCQQFYLANFVIINCTLHCINVNKEAAAMGVPAVLAALGKVCTSTFIFKTINYHPWSIPSLPASHHFHRRGDR